MLVVKQDYEEAFGFQILSGTPFFFFQKEGKIGFSYNEQETMLSYDEVPHFNCCSESVLNPIAALEMVAFFARTGVGPALPRMIRAALHASPSMVMVTATATIP